MTSSGAFGLEVEGEDPGSPLVVDIDRSGLFDKGALLLPSILGEAGGPRSGSSTHIQCEVFISPLFGRSCVIRDDDACMKKEVTDPFDANEALGTKCSRSRPSGIVLDRSVLSTSMRSSLVAGVLRAEVPLLTRMFPSIS